jgi:hypothetical protein
MKTQSETIAIAIIVETRMVRQHSACSADALLIAVPALPSSSGCENDLIRD